jgi:hypothetical protein
MSHTKAILCIGSSHVSALREGHTKRAHVGQAGGFDTWKQIGTNSHIVANQYVLGEAIDAEFAGIMSEVEVSAIFLCCGGGEHTEIALFNIWPFDVYMPDDDPQQAISGNCEVVPYDVMLATCASYISTSLPFVQRIKSLSSLPMHHILPPPPTAGEDYVRADVGPDFCEWADRSGISPAPLRQKVWRLCCIAARQIYSNMGIPVIEPPAAALDERGFLAPQYQRLDLVHANGNYGALVVDSMVSIAVHHASGTSE